MNKIKLLLLPALICLVGVMLFGCRSVIDFDYNIRFVVDGETVATVGTNGDKIAMPKNPTKPHFTFDGWYWDEGEWHDEFTLNSIMDQPLQAENTFSVYAKWKADPDYHYTVAFDANGGTGTMASQTIDVDKTERLPYNSFDAPTYKAFVGWNTLPDGSGASFDNAERVKNIAAPYGSVTLYAQWDYTKDVLLIDSVEDLESLRNNFHHRVYLLTADIDYRGAVIEPLCTNDDDFYSCLYDTFDGNGHVIKNFVINTPAYDGISPALTGLFGKNGGTIQNLGLEGFTISGQAAAAVATQNFGTIRNCYAIGTLDVNDGAETDTDSYRHCHAGGLVLSNYDTIENCYVKERITADVSWMTQIGGIASSGTIGEINSCVIANSYEITYTGRSHEPDYAVSFGNILAANISFCPERCYYTAPLDLTMTHNGTACEPQTNFNQELEASMEQLRAASFYTDTLGWSEDIWSFASLAPESGIYPSLRKLHR